MYFYCGFGQNIEKGGRPHSGEQFETHGIGSDLAGQTAATAQGSLRPGRIPGGVRQETELRPL